MHRPRSIEYRQSRQAFIVRDLASAKTAKQSGEYVAAPVVLGKLAQRLAQAKKQQS